MNTKTKTQLDERATGAWWWFEGQKPEGSPSLPLTYEDRELIKGGGGVLYIVSVFARSLDAFGWQIETHPNFEMYARGVMASNLTPDFIQSDPSLLQQYPPTSLKGIGAGLMWRPRRSGRSKNSRRP